MAKASMKAREERRRKTVLRYAAKRAELKEIIRWNNTRINNLFLKKRKM